MKFVDNSQVWRSEDHLGVLDEVVAVSSLNNAVDPGVESGKGGEGISHVSTGLGVGMEVSSFLGEEVGSESLMGVAENSVAVVAELGGNILAEELDLVEATLLSGFASISGISWLDSADVEAGSEGVGAVVWGVEEVMELSGWEVRVLLVDFGQDNWSHGNLALESSFLGGLVIRDLG